MIISAWVLNTFGEKGLRPTVTLIYCLGISTSTLFLLVGFLLQRFKINCSNMNIKSQIRFSFGLLKMGCLQYGRAEMNQGFLKDSEPDPE